MAPTRGRRWSITKDIIIIIIVCVITPPITTAIAALCHALARFVG